MALSKLKPHGLWACTLVLTSASPAFAQTIESVGTRALGMGGAFVAVASDSSATWWNPAGLAAGPFLDVALARTMTESSERVPAKRDTAAWFALTTLPFGFSYYRLRITDIRPFDPTGGAGVDREDRRAGIPVRSLAASQLGITLVQTIFPGVHTGTTLKFVRGTVRTDRADELSSADDLLDRGDDLDGGDADSAFDLDAGILAVAGPIRLGALVRNLREPEFGADTSNAVRFRRQVRIGVAVDAEAVGGPALTIAADVDLREFPAATGGRRNVALGAEHWFGTRRVAVRGGARFNTAGEHERSATAGMSVAVRAGLFVDAHVVRGGTIDDRGWGLGVRVSF
jgi:hypothetical protein